MRYLKIKTLLLALICAVLPVTTLAQNKVEAEFGASLVSNYIWRGLKLSGASIQPEARIGYKNFYAFGWGSVSVTEDSYNEINLGIGFNKGGFTAEFTDIWSDEGIGFFHYGAHNTEHVFRLLLGYDFGFASLEWDTNLLGCDGVNKNGKRAYSSYLLASVPFKLATIDWSAEVGLTPWATTSYEATGFSVCEVGLKASKELKITDHFSLPLFTQLIFVPHLEDAYFVFGASFSI